jgi:thiol-disulfide isomerase/thioredoxin
MIDSRIWRPTAPLAALFVFAAGLLVGFLVGCGSKAEPETAEVKKFRPVDDDGAPAAASGGVAGTKTRSGPAAIEGQPGEGGAPAAGGKAGEGVQVSPELAAVLNQLTRLGSQQPKVSNQQELVRELVNIQNQQVNLIKKALTLNPPLEIKRQLVEAQSRIYEVSIQLGVPGAMQQLTELGTKNSADSDPEIARIGRHATFNASLMRLSSQQAEDGKQITVEAKKLLDAEKGDLSDETIQLVMQTVRKLNEAGFQKDVAEVYQTLADALAGDPKRADTAKHFALQAKILKMDLDTLLDDVLREKPEANAKFEAALANLLKEPPTADLLSSVQNVGQVLEVFGPPKLAQACFDHIADAFKKADDPKLAEAAAEMADKAKQRLALVGKPFDVEGVTPDGLPFDWAPYAGKVVLVDFWATWCGPCLQELPNIRQNYEQYHAKGFDVVGVNLDSAASDLKQFLALQGQGIPWVTVTSQVVLDGKVGDREWSKIPMATKYGVEAIPFVVLVGKDGNVDSIHVRGPKLGARLKQLLGEPATTEVPADPTQPANAPPAAKTGMLRQVLPLGIAAVAAFLADEPAANAVKADDDSSNPYVAKPGLNASQLMAYLQKMLDRPQTIQSRPGFAEGIVDACDRVLRNDEATPAEKLQATQTKLSILHRDACDGKEAADKQLMEFVTQLKDDDRPEIAREVAFFRLERRVIEAKELPLDEIPALLNDVEQYMGHEKSSAKHLRLASSTVAAINRLEDGKERERQFAVFGKIFGASSDKELARYGKKLAKAKE